MTREDIEQLNVVEPYCFESDREEQWYNVGLKHGLEIADNNPKSHWISVKDDLPCNHDDFKYFNTTVLFLTRLEDGDLFATYMRKGNVTNTWHWVAAKEVTHWMSIPKLNAD